MSAPFWGALRGSLPRPGEVNAVNQASARAAQTMSPDDPLSVFNTPTRIGPEIHVKAGQLFESQNDPERALVAYCKALEIAPRDETAMLSIARLYDRKGNFVEARNWYEQTIAAHPQSARARNDLAICLARHHELQGAVNSLYEAVRLDPGQALYRNNLAKILVQLNRPDEALQHLQAVFPPAAAQYNLGYLLKEANRPDLAAVALQRALEIDPAFSRAEKMLRSLEAPASPSPAYAGTTRPAPHAVSAESTMPPTRGPSRYTAASPGAGYDPPQAAPSPRGSVSGMTVAPSRYGPQPSPAAPSPGHLPGNLNHAMPREATTLGPYSAPANQGRSTKENTLWDRSNATPTLLPPVNEPPR